MDHKVEKLLYSKQGAAEALSLSVRSIDYLITTQRLPMRRVGGKVMIPAGALRQFARGDHPQRIRGDGQADSIHSRGRRVDGNGVLDGFGPGSETIEDLPLRRASERG